MDTNSKTELVFLGIMNLDQGKSWQAKLKNKNLQLILNHNPSTCQRGCAVTVEVLCAPEQKEKVLWEMKQEESKHRNVSADLWQKIESLAFDPNQNETTCPACLTPFATHDSQGQLITICPECGLHF